MNAAACVSGKPPESGGIPGREYATGYGLLVQLRRFLELDRIRLPQTPSLVIQGFGNVGGSVASFAEKFNFKVLAVSDVGGGIYNPKGLNVQNLKKWYKEKKTLKGFPGGEKVTNSELLALKTDVLIPAALENQIRKDNVHTVKAKILYEGGNNTVTPEAWDALHAHGVRCIPGIAANVGGIVVSFLEWRKNLSDRAHVVDYAEQEQWVISELTKIMKSVIERTMQKSKEMEISPVDAAHVLAMETMWKHFKMKHPY